MPTKPFPSYPLYPNDSNASGRPSPKPSPSSASLSPADLSPKDYSYHKGYDDGFKAGCLMSGGAAFFLLVLALYFWLA